MKQIKKVTYTARDFANFSNEKAQELGKYLESKKISLKDYQKIYNDTINNNKSPFRELLEWNDTKAANEHRLQQIRNIVEHISVKIVFVGGETVVLPAFPLITRYANEPRQLVTILEALSTEDMRKQLLRKQMFNLLGWWEMNRIHKEFQILEDSIFILKDEFIKKGII